MDKDIERIVQSGADKLTKLKCIAEKAMEDERLITDNLLNPPKDILTRGQKISDKVARFGGSWAFIISFFIILIVWITYNSVAPKADEFDQ